MNKQGQLFQWADTTSYGRGPGQGRGEKEPTTWTLELSKSYSLTVTRLLGSDEFYLSCNAFGIANEPLSTPHPAQAKARALQRVYARLGEQAEQLAQCQDAVGRLIDSNNF